MVQVKIMLIKELLGNSGHSNKKIMHMKENASTCSEICKMEYMQKKTNDFINFQTSTPIEKQIDRYIDKQKEEDRELLTCT